MKLSNREKRKVLSEVMRLMYLALKTRPDILFSVSYLATKVADPSIQDAHKLKRILNYVSYTADMALVLTPKNSKLHVSVDASYGIHDDKKSHTGAVFGIGGATFACRSKKQQHVSNSSTDAELNALSDTLPAIVGMREVLGALGCPQQDHCSLINSLDI
jgi:hypothetical protein